MSERLPALWNLCQIPDINLVRVSLIPSTREKENVRGFPKIHNCKEEEDKTKKTRKRMANKPEEIEVDLPFFHLLFPLWKQLSIPILSPGPTLGLEFQSFLRIILLSIS